jgi:hypothetical protein
VEFYCDTALAKATKQTYKSAKRRYLTFCSLHDIAPIPTSEWVLCRYVAYLANEGLTHSTIRGYLSAVRHLHIEEDRGDPNISGMAKLELVLKGVKMVQATKPQPRVRQPITPPVAADNERAWRLPPAAESSHARLPGGALALSFDFKTPGKELEMPPSRCSGDGRVVLTNYNVKTPRERLAAISRKLSPSEPQEED